MLNHHHRAIAQAIDMNTECGTNEVDRTGLVEDLVEILIPQTMTRDEAAQAGRIEQFDSVEAQRQDFVALCSDCN